MCFLVRIFYIKIRGKFVFDVFIGNLKIWDKRIQRLYQGSDFKAVFRQDDLFAAFKVQHCSSFLQPKHDSRRRSLVLHFASPHPYSYSFPLSFYYYTQKL